MPTMRKYPPQASQERSRTWTEPRAKLQHRGKVPVVYYLCRNRHLEHPHFIEVPLSSSDGLYLKDVIDRLNVLRGRGMAGMYAWSCKRSYKTGFVWHDLGEDDLVVPAGGNEYVLKGSEILDRSHDSDRKNAELKYPPPLRSPPPHSSSSSGTGCSEGGAGSPVEFRVCKPSSALDAATQTEEARRKETCVRGVSTDDGSVDLDSDESRRDRNVKQKQSSEIEMEDNISSVSPGGKIETLESLIRAEVKMNSFRISEGDRMLVSTKTRLKTSNLLMQLITCGSISVKDHHSRFSHMKFTPTVLRDSVMLREFDCLSDNPRLMGLRLEDKEYFSGSLIETNRHREEAVAEMPTLKRSSSFNADRSGISPDLKGKELMVESSGLNAFPNR
ncbi:hypothetical protein J5N97_023110 [Dioscorea zingiberensis]|uniref:SOSEKI DIX-like domain-containing protein n=1 Tax=Dioscorea zingiberensis TaxID=325984 RepID=A0A9D5HBM0_9LILI|nr:hypothetical protein J5N97_023110 [Dioscorea zingiberensis]